MKNAPSPRPRLGLRLLFMPAFVGIMLITNTRLGVVFEDLHLADLARYGVSLTRLEQGEWYRLISGSFLSHDTGMLIRQVLLASAAIGWYEWHQGTKRAILMFFTLDIIGTLILMFGLINGLDWAAPNGMPDLADTFDVGMSAGGFGLIGASLYPLGWRHIALAGLMILLAVKLIVLPDPIADIAHLLVLPLGFLAERFLVRRRVK